jgi:hypothetical protein
MSDIKTHKTMLVHFEEGVWASNWVRGLESQNQPRTGELYKTSDLEVDVSRRLKWFGYVITMKQRRLANKS